MQGNDRTLDMLVRYVLRSGRALTVEKPVLVPNFVALGLRRCTGDENGEDGCAFAALGLCRFSGDETGEAKCTSLSSGGGDVGAFEASVGGIRCSCSCDGCCHSFSSCPCSFSISNSSNTQPSSLCRTHQSANS